jgi:hypothetical protein
MGNFHSEENTVMKIFYMNKKAGWKNRAVVFGYFLLISNLLLPSAAHAYVDPGSASIIVTSILGLIAALGYTFRHYFYKIKQVIFGRKAVSDKADDD